MEHKLSQPLYIKKNHVKIICNHILIEISNMGTQAQQIRNLNLFPEDERDEILEQIKNKLQQSPKL
jgi:hypothetical protein